MCLKRVQDASGTPARCICASTKPCDKAAARHTWVSRPFLPDGGASGTRVRCIWNVCECYLGAELYCSNVMIDKHECTAQLYFSGINDCTLCTIEKPVWSLLRYVQAVTQYCEQRMMSAMDPAVTARKEDSPTKQAQKLAGHPTIKEKSTCYYTLFSNRFCMEESPSLML